MNINYLKRVIKESSQNNSGHECLCKAERQSLISQHIITVPTDDTDGVKMGLPVKYLQTMVPE